MTISLNTLHIVLVEDSADDYDTVREALQVFNLPTRLSRVNNGDECMTLLKGANAQRPALILMDLNTASTDGREALRLIKTDPLLQAIPVVIVTASANPRDVDFCFQCGANAYHVKPVRYPDHLQMLAGLLKYWLVDVTTSTAPAAPP